MLGSHDGELVSVQPDEVPDGKESHQGDESFEEDRIERRAALFAHDGANTVRGKPLPIGSITA